MRPSSKGPLRHLAYHRLDPSIAQLCPRGEISPQSLEKLQKIIENSKYISLSRTCEERDVIRMSSPTPLGQTST